MKDLFHKEQQILDDALRHVNEQRRGLPVCGAAFETITKEYGILLKQFRKILKISDKASVCLLNDKRIRQEQIAELENELLQSQIAIMLSQIQPHFLYNSLVAIKELCHIDPNSAGEAVDEFSHYLRSNLDSLSVKMPIPFERELRHVQTYLSLEKRRFGDKLNFVFDIRAFDFFIPALTLQPIVENAVRHGVTKRDEGGTVTVRAEESEAETILTVIDDGVGFDIGLAHKNEHLRVGIANVRSRLGSMCAGSLLIESEPGVGATAVITIPKEVQPV